MTTAAKTKTKKPMKRKSKEIDPTAQRAALYIYEDGKVGISLDGIYELTEEMTEKLKSHQLLICILAFLLTSDKSFVSDVVARYRKMIETK